MANNDLGHKETDKILEELERRIAAEYKKAEAEVQSKLDDYLRRFQTKDEKWRQWVKDGKKTDAEYKKWRTGQIMIGQRWEELRQNLAEDYNNAGEIARSIVNGHMPDVYAINHNYATYEVETGALVDTSYTLYDRQTVERIMKDNPELLPPPGKKVSEEIRQGKALRWNRQQIQSVMLQSILQGESIPDIATRLAETVGDRNRAAAIRNARTMTTGAENAGRIAGYERAERMGIKLQKCWLATLDNRTRHSHRMIDGEVQPTNKKFSNGCRYPGDPRGPGKEIWNCRCTLISQVEEYEVDVTDMELRNDKNLGGMSYEEWKKQKKPQSNRITQPEETAKRIREEYIREYRRG